MLIRGYGRPCWLLPRVASCSFGEAVFGNLLLVASRMLAIAPFLCLALGAGLKKDETALVPVALEREGGQQRSGRRRYGTVQDCPLEFDLVRLLRQKRLWVYLGRPSSTLDIGRDGRLGLPNCFQIKAFGDMLLVKMYAASEYTGV